MEDFSKIKKRLLRNEEFRKEYEKLAPEFDLVRMLIRKRIEKGLTQGELARKIGTKQSAISRLESGGYNPTISVLKKVAKALDADLKISLQ
jgi:predicted transcriptional regulator